MISEFKDNLRPACCLLIDTAGIIRFASGNYKKVAGLRYLQARYLILLRMAVAGFCIIWVSRKAVTFLCAEQHQALHRYFHYASGCLCPRSFTATIITA